MLPTNTNVSVKVQSKLARQIEAVVVFISEGGRVCGDAPQLLDDVILRAVKRLIDNKVARGKSKEVVFDLIDSDSRGRKARRVFVVGVGKPETLDPEGVRQAAGAIARAVRKHRIRGVAIVPPVLKTPGQNAAEATIVGFLLASFDYAEYRGAASKKKNDEQAIAKPVSLTILATPRSTKQVQAAIERGRAIADAQNFARTIAFRPGNDINPPALAKVAQDLARQVGLECRVLDEKQMRKLGMGGILAVGGGSIDTPPRLIVLEWKGQAARGKGRGGSLASRRLPLAPLLLVGKAITFDTGGISIKPADRMGKMVFDKCGGMAVLGVMCAVARLKLPIHVVGILSSAENHISSRAYRPGDILRMYNGVTVEVTNTDAEGRLVLGDALAWGIETFEPAAVIDLATLTGGVVTALGRTMAGVMSNNDQLVRELEEISQLTGEKIWRLPIGPDQRDQIKSEVADIVNAAGREAHPLQGGAFLSFFIPEDGKLPWVHLDIAGVADSDKDLPYYKKGATGWGVRTLVEWVARRAAVR